MAAKSGRARATDSPATSSHASEGTIQAVRVAIHIPQSRRAMRHRRSAARRTTTARPMAAQCAINKPTCIVSRDPSQGCSEKWSRSMLVCVTVSRSSAT